MKNLCMVLSLLSLANICEATRFVVTNNSSQDELPVLFFIYHENKQGTDCGKKVATLPHGKPTTIESLTYTKWGRKKECCVKSIEIVTQDKKGNQTTLFTATAEELNAIGMKALTTAGQGMKSTGDSCTGHFEIMMQDFDVDFI